MNGEESTCGVGGTDAPGSVQCSVCKAITAPGNGCSADDCPVGVRACPKGKGECAEVLPDVRCFGCPDGVPEAPAPQWPLPEPWPEGAHFADERGKFYDEHGNPPWRELT